jgi:pSer/pThr/pTyr-binding forkhead associated (FHA) protein
MPKLTIVFDDDQEIVVPLADQLTVGSAEDNDVVVDDARLSPHHAEVILRTDGSVKVYDLGSEAGTFVNGQRVTKHTLADGDKLAFGPLKAVLDLELGATQATTAPVPAPASQVKTSAGTRRVPLPPATPPPEPQPLPSAELHAAENRLALLEASAKQAEENRRDWLAAVERGEECGFAAGFERAGGDDAACPRA